MKKILYFLIFLIALPVQANYYGKKKTMDSMLDDLDKEIKLYCQRNIGKIKMEINKQKMLDEKHKHESRYQLDTSPHNHQKNNYTTEDCYESEKNKINHFLNTFYNRDTEEVFINCFYEDKKYDRNISEELPKCIYQEKSKKCEYILKKEIDILIKSREHNKCMFN